MKVKGCVHVHIRNGRIANVFAHLTQLPENGVVHLVPDEELTETQFVESHPLDKNEILVEPGGPVFDLGDGTV